MSENLNTHRLYCLMRTDLASMNPGKAMAQAMHAQAMAVLEMERGHYSFRDAWDAWKAETPQGFGTTIVLGCSGDSMMGAVGLFGAVGVPSGVVHDPTHPLLDGSVLHLIPVDTCAWVFGRSDVVHAVTSRFGMALHP